MRIWKCQIITGWPGTIWIFSDPHFNHYNVLKFERTEFKNIIEHNEKIITGINSNVKKTDTIICLGDLGYQWEGYIDRIECENKVLIMGNHDKEPTYKYFEHFQHVFNGPIFLNQFIVLSHEPWPGCGEYCYNIHGHLHNAKLDIEHYVNANVAQTGYLPIRAKDIYSKNDELKRNHEHFMEEWYADHYYFINNNVDIPVKDHRAAADLSEIKSLVQEYNAIYHTGYTRRKIDWRQYDGSPLREFIFQKLDTIRKEQDNEDSKD